MNEECKMNRRRIFWLSCFVFSLGTVACSSDSMDAGTLCGNGVLDGAEACDDGNAISGDGCSDSCRIENGYKCPEPGTPCVKTDENPNPGGNDKPNPGDDNDDDKDKAVCGDGVKSGNEACDDGNVWDDDGCSSNCQIEKGYECPEAGLPCKPLCGNGTLDDGEECDDGDVVPGDGCDSACKVEVGWTCDEDGKNCYEIEMPAFCGDGVQAGAEECDLGSDNGTLSYGEDGCTVECQRTPYCGDGTKNGPEECDKGAENNTAGEYGVEGGCTRDCKLSGYCGDGVKNGDEACDPKDIRNTGGSCTDDCRPADGYECSTSGECRKKDCVPDTGCGAVNKCLATPMRVIEPGEECDQKGQGCSNSCKALDGYKCIYSPKPCSECSEAEGEQCKKIECGNGVIDPDGYEECDLGKDNGKNKGCSATCEVESGYACRIGADGKTTCHTVCGDGIKMPNEECDDGNTKNGDGCSSACKIEDHAICTSLVDGKKSNCKSGKCGDGKIGKGEVCDDNNTIAGDGCSSDCMAVEAFFMCPTSGGACSLTKCGDGKVNEGNAKQTGEECDLGSGKNTEGSGCSPFCRLEPGYECTTKACTKVRKQQLCGNGKLDLGEECDDGNNVGGDGCSPDCRRETAFQCDNTAMPSVCRPTCGDGIWNFTLTKVPGKTPSSVRDLIEECDDGNNIDGDGCSSDCKLEDGYYLDIPTVSYPDSIELPVTFRDFKGVDIKSGSGGIANTAWVNKIKNKYTGKYPEASGFCNRKKESGGKGNKTTPKVEIAAGIGHPDFENFAGNLCTGIMGSVGQAMLGRDGKPVLTPEAIGRQCVEVVTSNSVGQENGNVKDHILCPASFDTWYRDDATMNKNIKGTLLMKRTDAANGTYVFDSADKDSKARTVNGTLYASLIENSYKQKGYFAPLYNTGFNEGRGVTPASYYKDDNYNGSFTTEIHTTFQYNGEDASLEFSGDDDVWVYINNRLFVDVGGMHSTVKSTGTLKSEKCTNGQKCEPKYGIYEGGIYDLHIFHAERDRSASNFKLTLTGFVNTAKSTGFKTKCGDGVVAAGREECDYGDQTKNADRYTLMSCDPKTCMKITNDTSKTCGNGILEAGETCDTGHLCEQPKYEQLCKELGLSYKPNSKCNESACQLNNVNCGNGKLDGDEECDGRAGLKNGEFCTPMCTKSRCGDGYVDTAAGETCDLGELNDNHRCTTKCALPYCGDGIVSEFDGEVCDDGINDGAYGHCGVGCSKWGPRCGDGRLQADEECDNGEKNNTGVYGGCTPECKRASYCGDGNVDEMHGETCDFGDDNGSDVTRTEGGEKFRCSSVCKKIVVVN